MALVAVIIILVAALAWMIGKTQGRSSSPESSVSEQVIAGSDIDNRQILPAEASNHSGTTTELAAVHRSTEVRNADGVQLPSDWSPSELKLIKGFSELNSDCRGSYDPEVTDAACSQRDDQGSALRHKLRAANICFGKESDESAADNEFHRCTADSYRF